MQHDKYKLPCRRGRSGLDCFWTVETLVGKIKLGLDWVGMGLGRAGTDWVGSILCVHKIFKFVRHFCAQHDT